MTHLDTLTVSMVGALRLSQAREHVRAALIIVDDCAPGCVDHLHQADDVLFCQQRRAKES